MSSASPELETTGQAPPTAFRRRSWSDRLGAYTTLGKLKIFDNYLAVPLAWALLSAGQRGDGTTLAVLALLLVAQVGLLVATCALDDVSGVRDGIDTLTYDEGAVLRKRGRKPLLDGRVTEREALAFATVAATVGVLAYAAVAVIRDFEPLWLVPAFAVQCVCVLQYSWGWKLSYRGAQDLVVFGGAAANVVLTAAAASGGHVGGDGIVAALLCGAWLTQLTAFGNVHDREGDRRAGRRTMPVRLGEGALRRYLVGLYVGGWVILAVGIAGGAYPVWALALQVPAIALQVTALAFGGFGMVADGVLKARLVGLLALRVGWVGLFATVLAVGG